MKETDNSHRKIVCTVNLRRCTLFLWEKRIKYVHFSHTFYHRLTMANVLFIFLANSTLDCSWEMCPDHQISCQLKCSKIFLLLNVRLIWESNVKIYALSAKNSTHRFVQDNAYLFCACSCVMRVPNFICVCHFFYFIPNHSLPNMWRHPHQSNDFVQTKAVVFIISMFHLRLDASARIF